MHEPSRSSARSRLGARDFAGLRTALCDRHRVIALDWPDHGNSGGDREPASALRYGALLAGFADALGLADVVVLGNSIGGGAALRFAAARPELVCFETFPGGHSPFLECPDRFMPSLEAFLGALPAHGVRAPRDSAGATGGPA